jgi:hypothetical protein
MATISVKKVDLLEVMHNWSVICQIVITFHWMSKHIHSFILDIFLSPLDWNLSTVKLFLHCKMIFSHKNSFYFTTGHHVASRTLTQLVTGSGNVFLLGTQNLKITFEEYRYAKTNTGRVPLCPSWSNNISKFSNSQYSKKGFISVNNTIQYIFI